MAARISREDARHPGFAEYLSSGDKARDVYAAMTRKPAYTAPIDDALSFLEQSALSMVRLKRGSADGYVYVHLIQVPDLQRGNGIGEAVMRALCQVADRRGWTLTATPDARHGATSVTRLRGWFKRHGFRLNKGRRRDYDSTADMVRRPVGR
jgi:GNAT superfamily N-acetyltransferase